MSNSLPTTKSLENIKSGFNDDSLERLLAKARAKNLTEFIEAIEVRMGVLSLREEKGRAVLNILFNKNSGLLS